VRCENSDTIFFTKLCTNCTSSARFASILCGDETFRNAPKHKFRVQWGGSDAFVVKNSEVSSLHELEH
jgi:hypothetical protein